MGKLADRVKCFLMVTLMMTHTRMTSQCTNLQQCSRQQLRRQIQSNGCARIETPSCDGKLMLPILCRPLWHTSQSMLSGSAYSTTQCNSPYYKEIVPLLTWIKVTNVLTGMWISIAEFQGHIPKHDTRRPCSALAKEEYCLSVLYTIERTESREVRVHGVDSWERNGMKMSRDNCVLSDH